MILFIYKEMTDNNISKCLIHSIEIITFDILHIQRLKHEVNYCKFRYNLRSLN